MTSMKQKVVRGLRDGETKKCAVCSSLAVDNCACCGEDVCRTHVGSVSLGYTTCSRCEASEDRRKTVRAAFWEKRHRAMASELGISYEVYMARPLPSIEEYLGR